MLQAEPPINFHLTHCAIAFNRAQDIRKALFETFAGIANQDSSKQMSADGLGWVLEVFSRLADLPLA